MKVIVIDGKKKEVRCCAKYPNCKDGICVLTGESVIRNNLFSYGFQCPLGEINE
jgi:hypothetical protein